MTSASSDLVVIGSHAPGLFIRVDRIPGPGETVIGWDFDEPQDGGKGSNQAIAAARLGAQVDFVGRVGQDRIGAACGEWLRANNVSQRFLLVTPGTASGVGFIILDSAGIPAMVVSLGANAALTRHDVDRALQALTSAKVLLTQFEIDPQVALHAAQTARARGLITIINPAPAQSVDLASLSVADILIPNETEAKVLLGLNPSAAAEPQTLATRLMTETGAACVVVTLGEQGAVLAEGTRIEHIPAPTVKAVDTSGAGDMFCAAIAVGIVEGLDQGAAARWAAAVAALSVTRPGTIPAYPWRDEVNGNELTRNS